MSERIEQAVIAEQRNKIALGAALESAIENEAQAEEAAREARAETVKARRAAIRGGWDEKTLRRLGLLSSRPTTGRKKTSPATGPDAAKNEAHDN